MGRLIGGGLWTILLITGTCIGVFPAYGQSVLDISPGMFYDQVKKYALDNQNLAFRFFDQDKLDIANSTRSYVPSIEFLVAFCPWSDYDGKVVSVVATKTYKGDSINMVQTFHDLFQQMSGDKLDSELGTRTETEQGQKMGCIGVSIKHLLKNGETWYLGIFNMPGPGIQAIQLQRSVAISSVCKKT